MQFVQREVGKLFPSGWDREYYPNAALSSTLPVKSCVQRSIRLGGCRKEALTRHDKWNDHHDFVLNVLSEGTKPELSPSRITPVLAGGKWRIISVSDVEMNSLRPLHTAIYNHISRFDWLLRGEANPSSFKDFVPREGEIFVSGDYESATDNLNMFVQKVLLNRILRSTCSVPDHIKELARESQQPLVSLDGNVSRIRRGQLMGNLLSFPLLCIVNYLAFRYYTGNDHSIPVRINGDDIVFRAPLGVANRWREGVIGSGLVLSKGKTLCHSRYFSLNSKMFKSGKSLPKLIPVIRSSAMGWGLASAEPHSINGLWNRVKKDYPCGADRRMLIERAFLKANIKAIVSSRRSLTRGHDILFHPTSFTHTNLWKREVFYLSLEKEFPIPVPPAVLNQNRIPEGWELRRVEKLSKEQIELSKGIAAAFVACAWSPITDGKDTISCKDALNHSPYYTPHNRMSLVRRSRLLGLSPANCRRFLSPSLLRSSEGVGWRVVKNPFEILRVSRPSGKRVWLPAGPVPSQANLEEKDCLDIGSQSVMTSEGLILLDLPIDRPPCPPYTVSALSIEPSPCLMPRADVLWVRFCRSCGDRFIFSFPHSCRRGASGACSSSPS